MKFINTSVLSLCIILTACSTEEKKSSSYESATNVPQQNETTIAAKPLEVQFKSNGIQTIYSAYEKLRDALVATDYETAKTYAASLVTALKNDENTVTQANLAQNILDATGIDMARAAFSKLNQSMEGIFEGSIEAGELNKCFCPMALNNSGAFWFSTSKEILNPYFGDKMLKCGSVQKTYN